MKRPSYLGHADFSNGLNINYVDYLQAREFSDAVQTSISSQTKELITATDRVGNSQLIEIKRVGDLVFPCLPPMTIILNANTGRIAALSPVYVEKADELAPLGVNRNSGLLNVHPIELCGRCDQF